MDWRVLIIFNNYFHDVASATLLSSAVILWVLGRRAEREGGDAQKALALAYPTLTKFAWGALIWIILGGIPRTIFFYQAEFVPAGVLGIVPDLLIKHVIMFTAVIVGAIMWRHMAKVARGQAAGAGN